MSLFLVISIILPTFQAIFQVSTVFKLSRTAIFQSTSYSIYNFITHLDSVWLAIIACHYSEHRFWPAVNTHKAFYSWRNLWCNALKCAFFSNFSESFSYLNNIVKLILDISEGTIFRKFIENVLSPITELYIYKTCILNESRVNDLITFSLFYFFIFYTSCTLYLFCIKLHPFPFLFHEVLRAQMAFSGI